MPWTSASALPSSPGGEEHDTDRIKIIMDPGMAFGTGTHETTSLCLETLDSLVKGGERVLDIGTGSGILAIAALKLGAGSAEGVDIDPMCVRTAGENAARNGVADRFKGACRRSVRQGQRAVQHHHRKHRGGGHSFSGPPCAGADGPGRPLYRQRHH